MKRHIVTEPTKQYLSKYDLEGSEEDVIRRIREAFEQARVHYNEPTEFYLDWSPREWSDSEDLTVYAKRPETDAERAERLAVTEAQKAAAEARERKLLAELQAKYDDK